MGYYPRLGLPLTRCETAVAELAALGHTDQEIATELGKNLKTAQSHLWHCFVKLGLTNSWGSARVRLALMLQR